MYNNNETIKVKWDTLYLYTSRKRKLIFAGFKDIQKTTFIITKIFQQKKYIYIITVVIIISLIKGSCSPLLVVATIIPLLLLLDLCASFSGEEKREGGRSFVKKRRAFLSRFIPPLIFSSLTPAAVCGSCHCEREKRVTVCVFCVLLLYSYKQYMYKFFFLLSSFSLPSFCNQAWACW